MLEGYDIICFAPTDFWGMNPSCTTHIMKMLSRRNRVLYINPFSSDITGERKNIAGRIPRKIKSLAKFLRRVENNFYVFSPVFLPVQGNKATDKFNNGLLKLQLRMVCRRLGIKRPLLWVENLRAADLLELFEPAVTVFHVSDLFSKSRYAGNKEMLSRRRDKIVAASDLVICVSRALYDIEAAGHNSSFYLPHGVDFKFFRQASAAQSRPAELAGIRKPIAGYYGTMTANNDIELLLFCARKLPDISFVLAGQITSGDYSQLAKLDNVHLLGKVPYEQIPSLCASFDVCMLQWRMTEWIRCSNPLKLMEYMASGKPIVSVPIDEVVTNYSDLVSISHDKEEFCRAITWELKNDTPRRSARRIETASMHTWDRHIEKLSQLLADAIARKQSDSKSARVRAARQ